ncbi:hypothetical protein C8J57DRAFT_1368497, partial [Mycena rebaudengoi]
MNGTEVPGFLLLYDLSTYLRIFLDLYSYIFFISNIVLPGDFFWLRTPILSVYITKYKYTACYVCPFTTAFVFPGPSKA